MLSILTKRKKSVIETAVVSSIFSNFLSIVQDRYGNRAETFFPSRNVGGVPLDQFVIYFHTGLRKEPQVRHLMTEEIETEAEPVAVIEPGVGHVELGHRRTLGRKKCLGSIGVTIYFVAS